MVAHPEVAGSQPKETFYLHDPKHPLVVGRQRTWSDDGPPGYASFFAPEARAARIRIDGTTHCIHDPDALERAVTSLPGVRALFLIRHPSDRVRSSFEYSVENLGRVRGLRFDEYIDRMLAGHHDLSAFVTHSRSRWVLEHELEISDYVRHIQCWRNALGPQRVRVFIFEEVMREPDAFLTEVAGWCGLSPFPHAVRGAKNTTVSVRSRALHGLARNVAERLPRTRARALVGKAYRRLVSRPRAAPTHAERDAIARLDAYFAPHIAACEALLGRPIEAWRR